MEKKLKEKQQYDFNQYKSDATQHDVDKFSDGIKPKWYENIPFLGGIIYMWRVQIRIWNIDRGPLRKNIWVKRVM